MNDSKKTRKSKLAFNNIHIRSLYTLCALYLKAEKVFSNSNLKF